MEKTKVRGLVLDFYKWESVKPSTASLLDRTSLGFVNSLFSIIKAYVEASETSPLMDFISVLAKYFRGSLCQSHQTYCLNYSAAVFYLESLRQRDDFSIYLKWCEQNEQCRRLHLTELLVAPLHRLTRYPLLLKNIWKRSSDSTEKIMIYSIKEKVEKSIRDLEGKVKWLDNFQKFRHLQEIIIWPPLWDRDKRFFIPEKIWMTQITTAISCFTKSQETKKIPLFKLPAESSEI
ncbi:Pleckstrin homology domain-containing family G member 7 [Sciurus carolinensis]|uniref:Pleckstrin homology domain-containing family G member 7 n=1 Tax=Sciurus carolinensis TaxID=30640 RepID=A0AA41SPZ9_SCICA|nr:Pleckstrin homology domain-containing family G member 7 [Sciurus carolinensis]